MKFPHWFGTIRKIKNNEKISLSKKQWENLVVQKKNNGEYLVVKKKNKNSGENLIVQKTMRKGEFLRYLDLGSTPHDN